MLTKILFTLAVVLVIILIYSAKFRSRVANTAQLKFASEQKGKSSHWAIYLVAAILALCSAGFFYYKWQADHAIVTIRIVSNSNEKIDTYKAYQKDIKGRTFTTLDGRLVTLGDSDRIELLED